MVRYCGLCHEERVVKWWDWNISIPVFLCAPCYAKIEKERLDKWRSKNAE